MKKARYGGIPVPVPDMPSGIGGLGKFANQVRSAIKVLRDRPVIVAGVSQIKPPIHPFKVSANGDDTVTVAPGEIMSYGDGTFGDLSIKHYSSFDGGEATVTASGVIYGEIAAALALNLVLNDTWIDSNGDSVDTYYYRLLPDTLDTIAVNFATSMPSSSSVFYFEIAQVDLTDGVASVTKQVLTHNPILSGLSSGP
jgi:hypothetical protein